jgi:hypothetical protein
MKEIIVTSQAELDALPKSFSEFTKIIIKAPSYPRISVEARENSSVVAWENSSVSRLLSSVFL